MKDWGIKPWEMQRLTARDLQEIRLAEHTEAYVKQEQRKRQRGTGTETGLENRASKRERIREAKQKHATGD